MPSWTQMSYFVGQCPGSQGQQLAANQLIRKITRTTCEQPDFTQITRLPNPHQQKLAFRCPPFFLSPWREHRKRDTEADKISYLLWLLVSTRLLVISISGIASIVHARVLRRRCICIWIISLWIPIICPRSIPLALIWLSLNHSDRRILLILQIEESIHNKSHSKMWLQLKTCLFEGLRPHESLTLCPPN